MSAAATPADILFSRLLRELPRIVVVPPRSAFPGVVLTAALAGGGFGYLLLSPALAWMAYVSLPLMLIWVAGMGLWLSRSPAVSQGQPWSAASQPGTA